MPQRLDRELTRRGLVRSRTEAARLIAAGRVKVDGAPATKAAILVGPEQQLTVTDPMRWVSRGALKLLAALDDFGIDPTGRTALDLGASTGGFTQVLLTRGAAHVVALDVGHDQLAPTMRGHPEVTNLEGINARYLSAAQLAQAAPGRNIDLVVGDLSFISLRHILPAIAASLPTARDIIMLVKPQFEVGREHVPGGIVIDTGVAADAVLRVVEDARALGLVTRGFRASPITGTHGNREWLLWLTPAGASSAPESAPASAPAPPPAAPVADAEIRRMVAKGAA